MAMCGLISSSFRNARSTSSGYSLSGATPSASRAISRVGRGRLRSERSPGYLSVFQKSAQVFGALALSKASVR
ncbi:hypothetical protein D9M71_767960 [compost metagenome]